MTYDPYNVPPPRRPKPPWWRTRAAYGCYAVLWLVAEFLVTRAYLESLP